MISRPSDPVTEFVDRFSEKKRVHDFCDGRPAGARCLLVRTSRDVGLTFFLQHLYRTAAPSWLPVYADCRSSDPEVIFRRFFDAVEERKVDRWTTLSVFRELGEAILRLAGALLFTSPWAVAAGPFAASVLPKVATTAYSSTPSERFARVITSGRWKRPILFLVDNAQEIRPQSLNVLNTVFSSRYDHVRFVLSFVCDDTNPDAFEEFKTRLISSGLGVAVTEFPPPDDQFLTEIAAAFRIRLTSEERYRLLQTTNRRISRLIAFFLGEPRAEESLTTIEKEVLRYLIVAAQPLQRDDILAVILKSQRIETTGPATLKAIAGLVRKRLIIETNHSLGIEIDIAPGRHRAIRETLPTLEDFVAATELYRHFATVAAVRSPRHSESAYGALLYRLAKDVDPGSVQARAFDLVRISLGQADLSAARHYVDGAIDPSAAQRSLADLSTLLAFHVSVQEYDSALTILDRIGRAYWGGVRELRIIHAIAMNRVRAHQQSNGEIDELLPGSTAEEFALLTSYKVAGLLHDGLLGEARQTFESALPGIRQAANRGYALRNCAAVYFWGSTRDHVRAAAILDEAAVAFRQQNDTLGLSTCVNNQGALAGSGEPRLKSVVAALPMFEDAFESLAVFGTQHVEEVGANLGMALLLTRQTDRAAAHLRKLIAIASFDFPRVLMESALAVIEAMSEADQQARERMRALTARIAEVKLPEATYRANVNAAAISAIDGPSDAFERYVRGASASGFWAAHTSLGRVVAAARAGDITRATLPDYFSFDYFQYWSQNPLSVVAPAGLPRKAEPDDVSH